MTTLVLITPYVAFALGAAMMLRAYHLHFQSRPQQAENHWRKLALMIGISLAVPSMAHAAVADLRDATEAGNAIIMYLSGAFAAIGIVAAGVAMMTGRQSIAKWAFAGAMVSGLAFAIVRTMWSSMGLEASDVGTF